MHGMLQKSNTALSREAYMSLPQVASTWSLDQRVHLTAPECCRRWVLKATMVPAGRNLEMTRLQSLEAVAILPALQCIDQIPPATALFLSDVCSHTMRDAEKMWVQA